jgi:hypothetical protein
MRQGRVEQAEGINRDVLAIRRRVLGPEHPQTLRTRANLGRTLLRQRRYVEAEVELRATWKAQVEQRGNSHADTLSTLNALARCQALAGTGPDTNFVGTRNPAAGAKRILKKIGFAPERASQP